MRVIYSDNTLSTSVMIGAFSTTQSQTPTSEGLGGVIRVHMGVGGLTDGGEVNVASDGTITVLKDVGQLQVDLILRLGRQNATGVALLCGRMMYAQDGVEANGIQLGTTFTIEIGNANTIWRENFTLLLEPVVGSKYWIELAQDESGNASGGILTRQTTGTLSGWGYSASAQLRLSILK